jgi:hypothetical protein
MEPVQYYIYLIGVEGAEHVKFGYSKNPDKRLKQLQTGSAQKLILLNMFSYGQKRAKLMERKIHKCFSCYRMTGEWFEMDHVTATQLFTWANIRYEDESELLLKD